VTLCCTPTTRIGFTYRLWSRHDDFDSYRPLADEIRYPQSTSRFLARQRLYLCLLSLRFYLPAHTTTTTPIQDQHLCVPAVSSCRARPAPCLAVRILLRTTTTNSYLRLNELRRIVIRHLRHRVINLPIESSPQLTVRATPASEHPSQLFVQHLLANTSKENTLLVANEYHSTTHKERICLKGLRLCIRGGKVSRIPTVAPPRARPRRALAPTVYRATVPSHLFAPSCNILSCTIVNATTFTEPPDLVP